jgi:glyceraldehyde 3-phosphate dehydrogenase
MISVGINGFGRIGKCVFLQLLDNNSFSITCLNALNIKIEEIEDYLNYDTTHGKNNIKVKIIDKNTFQIKNHIIKLTSERDATKIDWTQNGCEYLIDATGSYLTTEKCKDHNAKYIVMTSPPKDDTKTIIYGVNEDYYKGERIISGSSCTTNCISPLLKILNDAYQINDCIFTTIHATTASQYVVDVLQKTSRTNRSILNNIIPHTTGASSSVVAVLPELEGKINGTSVRVPVVNCSLIDVTIQLADIRVTLEDISSLLKKWTNHMAAVKSRLN